MKRDLALIGIKRNLLVSVDKDGFFRKKIGLPVFLADLLFEDSSKEVIFLANSLLFYACFLAGSLGGFLFFVSPLAASGAVGLLFLAAQASKLFYRRRLAWKGQFLSEKAAKDFLAKRVSLSECYLRGSFVSERKTCLEAGKKCFKL